METPTVCTCPLERDVAQWLERSALPMSLPAVRSLILLGAGFSEKYHVSPLSILGHCFDVLSFGKALNNNNLMLYLPKNEYLVKIYVWMHRNGCSCSPLGWDGTRVNRSSDQEIKFKSRIKYLISDYKPLPLPLLASLPGDKHVFI